MTEENQREIKNVIFDNKFSVKFSFGDGKSVNSLSDNIWSFELPEISFKDFNNINTPKIIKLVVRSIKDGSVEQDLFDTLACNDFNISLSLHNPNIVDYEFVNCSVERVKYVPLTKKSQGGSPFNTVLFISVKKEIIHYGKHSLSIDAEWNYDNGEESKESENA